VWISPKYRFSVSKRPMYHQFVEISLSNGLKRMRAEKKTFSKNLIILTQLMKVNVFERTNAWRQICIANIERIAVIVLHLLDKENEQNMFFSPRFLSSNLQIASFQQERSMYINSNGCELLSKSSLQQFPQRFKLRKFGERVLQLWHNRSFVGEKVFHLKLSSEHHIVRKINEELAQVGNAMKERKNRVMTTTTSKGRSSAKTQKKKTKTFCSQTQSTDNCDDGKGPLCLVQIENKGGPCTDHRIR
jgi:hypothetical protein